MAELAETSQGALVLAAVLLALGVVRGLVDRTSRDPHRRRSLRRRTARRPGKHAWGARSGLTPANLPVMDAADQLRTVMSAEFSTQSVLNRGEARLFRELDQAVLARNSGWQVMAQVSLGEILRTSDAAAYRCINSKRVDLLLMDDQCQPRHAIEYQGSGHHQGTAAARDAVKKEALRRAGVGYFEVIAGQTTPTELRRLVEKLVDAPACTEAALAG